MRAASPQKIPPFHPHPSRPCHTPLTPAAGWFENVLDQAGGRPPGFCRNVRRNEGGGQATALLSWQVTRSFRAHGLTQPPEKPPAPVPACAGRQPGGGWKRACGGPSFGCGVGTDNAGAPASITKGQARVGECRPPLSRSPCPGLRHGDSRACRMRTPSGGYRAAQGLRHPVHVIAKAAACTPHTHSRRRTPRAALRISSPHHTRRPPRAASLPLAHAAAHPQRGVTLLQQPH